MVKKIFVVAAISLTCGLVMASESCENKPSSKAVIDAKIVADLSCKADNDCTAVKADCCGCFKGGKQQSIARVAEEKHNLTLSSTCSGIMCPQFMSQDLSCKQKVQCHEGQCILK